MILNKKRVILCGRAASGKDYLRKLLQEAGLKYQISYTTRPPRQNEIHGIDYFFLSEPTFKEMIDKGEFYEYVVFNSWYYGTSKEQFYSTGSVFIMTPAGLSHLSDNDRDESLVIYLDMPESIRRVRIAERNDADSVERRIIADNKDFDGFENFDIHIENPEFTIEEFFDNVKQYEEIHQDILKHTNNIII
jgi:guanylate kinase